MLGNDRFPSPADPFYLLAYPVLAAGLLLLARGRRPRGDRSGPAGQSDRHGRPERAVLGPAGPADGRELPRGLRRRRRRGPGVPLRRHPAAGDADPVPDHPGRLDPSLRLLLAAVALLIAADTASLALDLVTFDSTHAARHRLADLLLLWGAAALHPSMYALSKPARRSRSSSPGPGWRRSRWRS